MIYLATSYSHKDASVREKRYEVACMVFQRLVREGNVVYSPIVHCHPTAVKYGLPTDALFWKNFNEHIIRLCTELWVVEMEGLSESKGIQMEIKFAESLELPVRYIKTYE